MRVCRSIDLVRGRFRPVACELFGWVWVQGLMGWRAMLCDEGYAGGENSGELVRELGHLEMEIGKKKKSNRIPSLALPRLLSATAVSEVDALNRDDFDYCAGKRGGVLSVERLARGS